MKAFARLFSASLLALCAAQAVHAQSPHSVVLVHGAFADGSSWERVIAKLQAKNDEVIAVQLPLTSLRDDVAATQRAIARAHGDVVLVGHSWGGTVITEAGDNAKVKALVYVAAFAPDKGQSTGELASSYPAPPGSAALATTSDGFLYLPAPALARDFAPDLPSAQQRLLPVTQGPIRAAAFSDKVTHAAWAQKPSWYLVSTQDRMINPDLERAMAKKIHAQTREVAASHVSMLSQPDSVANIILAAVGQAK
ncbi:alpha/beta fold hydrolase [Franconibacter pulveris 1160]|uniref:Alpha/beta hydrolase n=1 Tax=Franconibacter daqui TaxID=2047724 RepID=A0ABV1PS63_9ENTR|nr:MULTISPECIES: alpha/beta hydrolase [Franconibacter]MCK1968069.1 alpha/beta hydrolase [Franconibacter sp. IITDAS19]